MIDSLEKTMYLFPWDTLHFFNKNSIKYPAPMDPFILQIMAGLIEFWPKCCVAARRGGSAYRITPYKLDGAAYAKDISALTCFLERLREPGNFPEMKKLAGGYNNAAVIAEYGTGLFLAEQILRYTVIPPRGSLFHAVFSGVGKSGIMTGMKCADGAPLKGYIEFAWCTTQLEYAKGKGPLDLVEGMDNGDILAVWEAGACEGVGAMVEAMRELAPEGVLRGRSETE